MVELLYGCVDTAVFELEAVEALHAYDGEEVVEEEENDHGREQARHQDHRRPEHVSETLLHPEQRKQSANKLWMMDFKAKGLPIIVC